MGIVSVVGLFLSLTTFLTLLLWGVVVKFKSRTFCKYLPECGAPFWMVPHSRLVTIWNKFWFISDGNNIAICYLVHYPAWVKDDQYGSFFPSETSYCAGRCVYWRKSLENFHGNKEKFLGKDSLFDFYGFQVSGVVPGAILAELPRVWFRAGWFKKDSISHEWTYWEKFLREAFY